EAGQQRGSLREPELPSFVGEEVTGHRSILGGRRIDPNTARANSAAMIPSDHSIGNLPPKAWLSHTILRPTKIRMSARAYLRRWKRSIALASRKYIARSPRMARMF